MRGENERQATMMMALMAGRVRAEGPSAAADQVLGRLGVGAHVVPVREALDCLEGSVSTTDSTDFGQ